MSFEGERGPRAHKLIEQGIKLEQDIKAFIDNGGKPEKCDSTRVSTVAEIKAKGLLDIENIKVNRKAKRPKA